MGLAQISDDLPRLCQRLCQATLLVVLLLVALCWRDRTVCAQLSAFPGAEGEGRFTSGGRGGDVYHVTNLNDTGLGSLRNGIDSATGPRTIVFDVSGAIGLQSTLRVRRSNITIAGQTAPGQGISIFNYGVNVQNPNVIMRHIRVRPGDANKGPKAEGGFSGDAITIATANVILDHVSASWGIDENLSVAGNGNTGITVQYSIISEGLDQTGLWHDEWNSDYDPGGPSHHSHGSLIKPTTGDGVITYHHNLWSNNWNRNPAVGNYTTDQTLKADVRNNVLYNNRYGGYSSGDSERIDMNYVGNYIISGPDTPGSFEPFDANAANHMFIYRADNKFDSNKNGILDGSSTQSNIVKGSYTLLNSPFAMAPVTTDSVNQGFANVMATSGAFFWNRDPVDARLISEASSLQGGQIIDSQEEVGGYPAMPVIHRPAGWDTDGDGMPTIFELFHGLNPNNPNDRNGRGLSPQGYTNLEFYLDALTTGTAEVAPVVAFVNRDTARITLQNISSSDIVMSEYRLSSASGELNPSQWLSIADNYDVNGDQTVDDTFPWLETSSTPTLLSEREPNFVGTTLAPGQIINLGQASTGGGVEDIMLDVFLESGSMLVPAVYRNAGADNADFDSDGDVDGNDFLIWQRGFGTGAAPAQGDSDRDGDVDEHDLNTWKAQYGIGGPPLAGAAAVPESQSLLLVGLAVMTALANRLQNWGDEVLGNSRKYDRI